MGHLYHGYVSHNQRVIDINNRISRKSSILMPNISGFRSELINPSSPPSERLLFHSLAWLDRWIGFLWLGKSPKSMEIWFINGCGWKWKTDVGPQMWMSSLVFTIHNFGVPSFDPYPNGKTLWTKLARSNLGGWARRTIGSIGWYTINIWWIWMDIILGGSSHCS